MKEYLKYPPNAIRICIDRIEEEICGRVYTPLCAEELQFTGLQELLLRVDNLFDETGYPQAFTKKRTFHKIEKEKQYCKGRPQVFLPAQEIVKQQGSKKTFDVIVKSRRNSSWQGMLQDRNKDTVVEFGGELELLKALSIE